MKSIYFILLIMLMPLVVAQTTTNDEMQTIRSGFEAKINIHCFDENQEFCGPSVDCNVNVFSPTNGSLFISNILATRSTNYYYFNLTADQTITPGIYSGIVKCTDYASFNGDQIFAFRITPTGNQNTIWIAALIFIVGGLLYVFAFWKQDAWTAILGSLLYMGLGVYSYLNGIGDYRDWRTDLFGIVIIGVGAYIAVKAGYEVIQENL